MNWTVYSFANKTIGFKNLSNSKTKSGKLKSGGRGGGQSKKGVRARGGFNKKIKKIISGGGEDIIWNWRVTIQIYEKGCTETFNMKTNQNICFTSDLHKRLEKQLPLKQTALWVFFYFFFWNSNWIKVSSPKTKNSKTKFFVVFSWPIQYNDSRINDITFLRTFYKDLF